MCKKLVFGTSCELPTRNLMSNPNSHVAKLVFSTVTSVQQGRKTMIRRGSVRNWTLNGNFSSLDICESCLSPIFFDPNTIFGFSFSLLLFSSVWSGFTSSLLVFSSFPLFSSLPFFARFAQPFTIFPGLGLEPELAPPNFLGNKICGLIFTIWLVAIYYFASCSHSFYIYSETDRSTAQWWQWWCWFWVRLRPMEYFPSNDAGKPEIRISMWWLPHINLAKTDPIQLQRQWLYSTWQRQWYLWWLWTLQRRIPARCEMLGKSSLWAQGCEWERLKNNLSDELIIVSNNQSIFPV